MSTTVICDNCGHTIHASQPAPTLPEAMDALNAAALDAGYSVESITLTQGPARIRWSTDDLAMPDDALDAITRRVKEAKDRGEPLA